LENACLDQGKINIFKKKDIKLKKSIDLANVLRYPVSNNWSSSQQHQSLYHEVNATKGQVEPAAISISSVNFQESHSPQWKHHDESSTQRRSLLDELKAFQHQQQQHSSPQRESVDHAPSNINQPTVQQSIHSDRPSLAEQVQDLQEKDQEDHSIEVTRNFFNNLIKENKEKIKEQEDKPIETTRNFFNSLLNEKPSNTNHLNTHEHINKQPEMPIINHTQPKFTDFSDTYQKIKQLREQIRQVSQPRSRNEFTETKRTREYEGSHFIDERIKRARKVLKASKEKRRKWLSKK
jgi:hypothetical protein